MRGSSARNVILSVLFLARARLCWKLFHEKWHRGLLRSFAQDRYTFELWLNIVHFSNPVMSEMKFSAFLLMLIVRMMLVIPSIARMRQRNEMAALLRLQFELAAAFMLL